MTTPVKTASTRQSKSKCVDFNSLVKSLPVGLGSNANGGSPAAMGHRFAFGNTAEHCRCKGVGMLGLGCEARRSGAQGPLCQITRVGWVAKHEGQYQDALSRRTKVCLMLVESLGGIYYIFLQAPTSHPCLPSGQLEFLRWIALARVVLPPAPVRLCSITTNVCHRLRSCGMLLPSSRRLVLSSISRISPSLAPTVA
jgi:hypothetical protein